MRPPQDLTAQAQPQEVEAQAEQRGVQAPIQAEQQENQAQAHPEPQGVQAQEQSQLERVEEIRRKAAVEPKDFCDICEKKVGKQNWASHLDGKGHWKEKRKKETKDKAVSISVPVNQKKSQQRPGTKQSKPSTLSHVKSPSVLPAPGRGHAVFKTTSPNVRLNPVLRERGSKVSSTMNSEGEPRDRLSNPSSQPGLNPKITMLPSHMAGILPTGQMDTRCNLSASKMVSAKTGHQTVTEIEQPPFNHKAEDLAASLKMYVKPAGLNEDGSEKTSLDEILERAELPPEDGVIPKERARALDQGESETCTLHAVANAVVEDLQSTKIDVSLDEVVGALKQGDHVDIREGNNVEDFDGQPAKNVMDKSSKAYGNIVVKTYRVTKEDKRQNIRGKHLLVFNRIEDDPETAHCVYLKRIHHSKDNTTLEENICEVINSWGKVSPKLYIPFNQRGNRFYKVSAEWNDAGPTEQLSSISTRSTDISSNIEPSHPTEILSESEEPAQCVIS